MFVVPLSAYAGYPHRTPKLAFCLDLDESKDIIYAFMPEPELALSSDTNIAHARYLRATEDRRAARQAYAGSIILDQLHHLQQQQDSLVQPRSSVRLPLPHGDARRQARVARTPSNSRCHAEASDVLIRTLQTDERRLREEDEIQRRRQALMAEQAQASRMRARERAFAQALRVARKIVNRPPLPTTVIPAATLSMTYQPRPKTARPASRLCIAAAPSRDLARELQRTPVSAPKSRPRAHAHTKAFKALELLEAEFAALPLDFTAAQRKHLLTTLLERADAVESGGSEPVRCARRALVRKVQDALDSIDR